MCILRDTFAQVASKALDLKIINNLNKSLIDPDTKTGLYKAFSLSFGEEAGREVMDGVLMSG